MDNLLYEVALPLIPQVGGGTARTLVRYFNTATEVFKAPKDKLLKVPRIGAVVVANLVEHKTEALRQAEKIIQRAAVEDVQLLYFNNPLYPERLRHLPDAPLLLYYKGTADLNAGKVISIVGTRKCTRYGQEVTDMIVQGLVQQGALIVSGLAYGIDIAAHKAALKHGLPTVGAMASGIDSIYPALHQKDAEAMVQQGGILTEFPFGTKPDGPRFPARNRIIAGMADCTIVVESTMKGGSLISADLAHGYDREVMAVPGPITSETSQGCNQLIRNLKAVPYTKPKDLEELLNWDKALGSYAAPLTAPTLDLSQFNMEECLVLRLLQQAGPTHIDVLSRHTSFSSGELSSILFTLEMSGYIKALPGKLYGLT